MNLNEFIDELTIAKEELRQQGIDPLKIEVKFAASRDIGNLEVLSIYSSEDEGIIWLDMEASEKRLICTAGP